MMERRSKYNASPVEADGYRFDSRAEYARYTELRLLVDAGVISALVVHPRFIIVPKDAHGKALYYEADFWYTENGSQVVEDVKGVRTDVYKIKRRLFLARYPHIKFVEVTK